MENLWLTIVVHVAELTSLQRDHQISLTDSSEFREIVAAVELTS